MEALDEVTRIILFYVISLILLWIISLALVYVVVAHRSYHRGYGDGMADAYSNLGNFKRMVQEVLDGYSTTVRTDIAEAEERGLAIGGEGRVLQPIRQEAD